MVLSSLVSDLDLKYLEVLHRDTFEFEFNIFDAIKHTYMSRTSTKRQENKKRQAEETGLNVPIEIYLLTRKNIFKYLQVYNFKTRT